MLRQTALAAFAALSLSITTGAASAASMPQAGVSDAAQIVTTEVKGGHGWGKGGWGRGHHKGWKGGYGRPYGWSRGRKMGWRKHAYRHPGYWGPPGFGVRFW